MKFDIQGKAGAARLSVVSNMLLVLLKLGAGFATGSISVLSEAVHSGVDLLASGIAYFSIRAAERPEDEEHLYGHGKIENLSAVVEGILIFAAAGYILYEAYHRLRSGAAVRHLDFAVAVMGLSAFVNWFVSGHLFRIAARTESPALLADAHHLRIDVLTSAAVAAALLLVRFTGNQLLDPAIAAGVAFFILRTAWRLTSESGGALLDRALPPEERDRLRDLLETDLRVLGYHRVRARSSGGRRHIDLHLLVDPDLSLRAAHELAEEVEESIRTAFPGAWVMIHVEPATEEELAVSESDPGIWKGRRP